MMIVQKQNLKELIKLTLLNILSVKGVLYTHYKNKQKQKGKTMENNTQQTEKYKIIKFRKSGTQKVLLTNLSLNEARMYCSRPDTKGKNWFCGFTKQ
jgi:hypothetical protein